ncbi:type I secretion system permease/ATPase [Oceanomicrobium pacificus]|uniref:type I secretion system permease/ATPase n=1 Tax=Oceanomicrobium pacificus TaxID=2692916 RepID=UPI002E2C5324|nr:type I secretion system permease/ATPase [Oceanomicrobium pacificus]
MLAGAVQEVRGRLLSIGVFSVFINLLMLTGPLFMLQVYDRVLTSRSEATLAALVLLVGGLYVAFGCLDFVRGRLMMRVGATLQSRVGPPTFAATLRAPASQRGPASSALDDLDSVGRFFAAPAAAALLDLPWAPIFLAAIFVFDPFLGWLALAGAALLVALMVAAQAISRAPGEAANRDAAEAARFAGRIRSDADTVLGLGMDSATVTRWTEMRSAALDRGMQFADRTGGMAALTRALRLFLQSLMLAAGAWLVLQGSLTAGAMIAASILLGRALAPVESLLGQWGTVLRARQGWRNLHQLHAALPDSAPRTDLPRPDAQLDLTDLGLADPSRRRLLLRGISCSVAPGQALGVIGESASGKSTLARVLTGLWPPSTGTVRLGGVTLDQFTPEARAAHIGFLPQTVQLFPGTIAQNIARLDEAPDADAVVAAARTAGAHEMILKLPDGYDTRIEHAGEILSGGQVQRIGLARALFGAPVCLVLDEPNANLDATGSAALNAAIRAHKAAGGIAVIMAHRPAAIAECDLLMVLSDGAMRALGPRDEVLRKQVRNHATVLGGAGAEARS